MVKASVTNVVWFEIPVLDMSRARSFYENVFNISMVPMDMLNNKISMFPNEGPVLGSLIQAPHKKPSEGGVCIYFDATDKIKTLLKRVEKHGGEIILDKVSMGDYGSLALFQDTEGNRIGLCSKPKMITDSEKIENSA